MLSQRLEKFIFILLCLYWSNSTYGQPGGDSNVEINLRQQVDEIATRGLQYLVRSQSPLGSWSHQHQGPGTTGLALMAFLASGENPNQGKYHLPIRSALRSIIRSQNGSNGLLGENMYQHAFATKALAKAKNVVDETLLWEGVQVPAEQIQTIHQTLEKAVRLAVTSQSTNLFEAWRYQPTARDADSSVTGSILLALLAARDAGIDVSDKSVDAGIGYLLHLTGDDGTVGYSVFRGAYGKSICRSSLACLIYHLADRKDLPQYQSTKQYVISQMFEQSEYREYSRYYQSQALLHVDPRAWSQWRQQLVLSLQTEQNQDGSFPGEHGQPTLTALNLLALMGNEGQIRERPAEATDGVTEIPPNTPLDTVAGNPPANAAITLERLTNSTAAVIVDNRFVGTAFCISNEGMFVAVDEALKVARGQTKLVRNMGTADESIDLAAEAGRDAETGLVYLRVAPRSSISLPTDPQFDPYESLELSYFGYPFSGSITDSARRPELIQDQARIQAVQREHGIWHSLLLDKRVLSVFLGGPVFNAQGKLVGVLSTTRERDTRVVSLQDFTRFVSVPKLSFSQTSIPIASSYVELAFPIQVDRPALQTKDTDVIIRFEIENQSPRILRGVLWGSEFQVKTILQPVHNRTEQVIVEAEFPNGKVCGLVENRPIELQTAAGSKMLSLNQILVITQQGPEFSVRTDSHRTELVGRLHGLTNVPLVYGETHALVDMSAAQRITTTPYPLPTLNITYHASLKSNGKSLLEQRGPITLVPPEQGLRGSWQIDEDQPNHVTLRAPK